MIDLKKLEEKFQTFFDQETENSFNEWLEDKKRRETIASLGEGELFEKYSPIVITGVNYYPQFSTVLEDIDYPFYENSQYAKAA